jgi:hypothetical protein
MPGYRHDRLIALLAIIAKWTAALCIIAFACLITMGIIYRRNHPPDIVFLATVLTSFATGIVSLTAFALRGAVEGRWRFSLGGLLIVTTALAFILGMCAIVLRGS